MLPTVVVVGVTPVPGADVDPDQVAAPVQTATAADMERTRSLDLSEFMRRSLGSVYVNDIQNNALQPDVNFRGYSASPLLGTPQGLSVYLDGMRLNQAFGDVVSWDLIPREAIASMALMPGSNPLFGLNTLGGALSLRSRDGFSDPGYSVGLNYGSNSRRQADVQGGGHTDSGYHWYVTANRLEDDGWRDDSPTGASQVFGKWGWRGGNTDLALSGAWADTDLTGNGLQDRQFLRNDYASIYTRPDETKNQAWLLNLTGSHAVDDSLTISGNAHFRRIDTTTFNGDLNDGSLGESLYQPSLAERSALSAAGFTGVPVSGETQANTPFPKWRCIANALLNAEPDEKCNGLVNRTGTDQRDFGVSLQAVWRGQVAGNANQFTLGGGIIDSRAHFVQSSQFGFLMPDRGIIAVEGPGAFADGTQDSENAFDSRVNLKGQTQVFSLFASNTTQLVGSVLLTLSARFDRTVVDNDDAITPAGEPGTLTAKHTFNRLNPAAGLTFHPTGQVTAYLGYSQGSRAPSAIELGCADPENPCRLPNAMAGDPPLDAVVTRTLETGLRGRFREDFTWNLGVFRADNRRDILFVADDTSGFGYFRNFGRTRRQGIELGATGTVASWTAGFNFTFLDATYRSAEALLGAGNSTNDAGPGFEGSIEIEPGNRIPLTPRRLFKAFAEWRMLPRLSATADFVAVSGAYARGNENNAHQPDGLFYLGAGRSGGYGVVNLGLEYKPVKGLSVFGQVNNLLDRHYYSAAQLGSTGFDAQGNFVARPFAGPVVDGERPITGSTFFAPGAPRAFWFGARCTFGS
ncbi:MAG TPA: TonB-dependent receptor [Steroidobacteraceae bacterium]|nr:TonB-dependent receptor [Steroidobacteraceae bacterium]